MFINRYAICFALFVSTLAFADDAALTQFSRIDSDDLGEPRALQVAIVSYVSEARAEEVRIDLIGAVHIGDSSYYAELNRRFSNYDALLYELVAPEGTVITPESESKSLLSGTQRAMRSMLDLSYQLEEIDYTQDNFVHADLSPGEMSDSMAERGESLYTYFWNIFFAAQREASRDPLGINGVSSMLDAFGSNKKHPLKVLLAKDFADLDRFSGMLGDDSTSAIIGARNERAIEVMLRELDNGKDRIGVFYGAAHMRDLEHRLRALGFVPVETHWVDAWVLD